MCIVLVDFFLRAKERREVNELSKYVILTIVRMYNNK